MRWVKRVFPLHSQYRFKQTTKDEPLACNRINDEGGLIREMKMKYLGGNSFEVLFENLPFHFLRKSWITCDTHSCRLPGNGLIWDIRFSIAYLLRLAIFYHVDKEHA